ncbi:hypothetical protein [Tabrizicola sp.]|uniref:hypothetical protein n=1 Tax=Tabrizicola sp. TaxID=2005166 RepID=UPI001A5CE6C6|nr:hypothetical protein [Tabrizicola sp.]MBL9073106.1 hypothetical protein [Tabrizicola sp.]
MRAALLLALLATPASATCQGDEAFSCRIGKKTLEVCYWKGALIYSYGREGKPELTIAEPLETVAYTPWPGIGRAIWDTVAFQNDGTTYEVWTSFDKMDENAILEGGVNVMQGDKTLATLTCDKGSVIHSLDPILDLKARIGQCWAPDTQSWGNCN